jgi:hypothetical protein
MERSFIRSIERQMVEPNAEFIETVIFERVAGRKEKEAHPTSSEHEPIGNVFQFESQQIAITSPRPGNIGNSYDDVIKTRCMHGKCSFRKGEY